MKSPNYSSQEYLDQNILNTGFGQVSGAIAQVAFGISQAGLMRPDAALLAFSGLSVSATLPTPFHVLFGNGTIVKPHGTVTGSDTTLYSASFAGLVPVSGSPVTAYMVASQVMIQQDAFTVIGPPVGHPDYNPNFQPYTAYATNVSSISVATSLTAPDNITTFEIGRTSLASGATGMTLDTKYQVRAAAPLSSQIQSVSGVVALSYADLGRTFAFGASGIAVVPAASGANGGMYLIACTGPSSMSVQTSSPDLLYGNYLSATSCASGVSGISLAPGDLVAIHAENGRWQTLGGTAGGLGITQLLMPTGATIDFAGNAAPSGWVLCYGQAISRVAFSTLFGVIGTTYGVGDGTTTFNVPDCRGRQINGLDNMGGVAANRVTAGSSGVQGSTLGGVGGDQLAQADAATAVSVVADPAHQHTIGNSVSNTFPSANNFPNPVIPGNLGVATLTTDPAFTGITVTTTITSALHGAAQNMPPVIMMNKIIKT